MSAFLEAEVARLTQANEEYHLILQRQSDLLTDAVNTLRGDPGPLALHSHHDIAERIRELQLAIDDLWSHIGPGEIRQLESLTVATCVELHERLYHGG